MNNHCTYAYRMNRCARGIFGLMKAYWCAFSDDENIVLLRSEVEVPPENIWEVRPFEAWK